MESTIVSSSATESNQIVPIQSSSRDQIQLNSSYALKIKSLNVEEGGIGILNGTLNNYTVNRFICPTGSEDTFDSEVVKEIVTDAFKEQSEFESSLFGDESGCVIRLKTCPKFPSQKRCRMYTALTVTITAFVVYCVINSVLHPGKDVYSEEYLRELCPNYSADSRLKIVCRAGWGAVAPRSPLDPNTLPVTSVVICHTVTRECDTTAKCSALVKRMQTVAMHNSMLDVNYNFMVGGDGKVYEARGWDLYGAHTCGHNYGTLGVAFIGTFTRLYPTPAMVQAFNDLVELGVKLGKVHVNYTLVGACQLINKASPGMALVETMKSWPHFDTSLSTENC